MALRLEEDHPSIVVVGGFEPRLLHPQWFRAEKLLGQSEAEQADVKLVHRDVTEWSTEWLLFQATRERFVAQAKVESAVDALRDFVLGILQVLDSTLTVALGLNRSMHFDVGGEENWHTIGHRLAPKELWKSHLTNRPGLGLLQMVEPVRRDDLPGKTIVTVQPSQKYKHAVVFDVNNEVANSDESPGTAYFSQVIRDHLPRLLAEARSMGETILQDAMA